MADKLKNKIMIKKKSNSPSIKDILKKLKKPKSKDEEEDGEEEDLKKFNSGQKSTIVTGRN